MAVCTVVGAPAWDRAWSLPLWFESVRANCDEADTGLVFVVPASDGGTREAITGLSEGFAWVEVLRDRGEPLGREERPRDGHRTLASARNQILQIVNRVRPLRYVSWDTDLLMPPGAVEHIAERSFPICTAWTWLNRQPPKAIRHFDGEAYHEVFWQDPVRASAMAWDRYQHDRAMHYPAEEFAMRANGFWRCGVSMAFQVMDARAYAVASYEPHHDGEDITFSAKLAARGVDRWCCGAIQGVHLYDRARRDEIALGWPEVLQLAEQRPLASLWTEPRTPEYTAFGFFPKRGRDGSRITA